jgi:hypothetical protein
MILPDFIIIGAQKAGTTVMWHALRSHPDISHDKKEKRLFVGADQGGHWDKGPASFKELFSEPYKVLGDASPSYLHCTVCARRILSVAPFAKIIVSLRNPVDRAYSAFKHFKKDSKISFNRSWDVDVGQNNYKRIGHYAALLKHWYKYWDKDNIKIVCFEEFKADNNKIIKEVQEFIGVEPMDLEVPDRVRSYDPMTPTMRAKLTEYFKPKNEELYELIGRDLGWDD